MSKNKDFSEIIDEMAIVTDALFSTAFDERPDRAEFLIRDVLEYLGYENFEIISSKTQVRKSHLLQHDTVTDVEVKLESGELIIVEVQLSHPERFSPKRGRYVLASNDISYLKEGMNYSELPKQILIVISEDDLNDSGLPIATAKRIISETGQIIDDEQTIVYVNHENITDEDTKVNQYIKDLFEPDYHKAVNPKAREILKEYKEDKEGRMHFEGKLQELINQEVEEQRRKDQKVFEEQRKEDQRIIENLRKELHETKEELSRVKN